MRMRVPPSAKRRAIALMGETLEVSRRTGERIVSNSPPFDTVWETVTVYDGPGKIQTFMPQDQTPEATGATVSVTTLQVHFPLGDFVPLHGDLVTVVASKVDQNMVGKTVRIVSVLPTKTHATSYRVYCEEVSVRGGID